MNHPSTALIEDIQDCGNTLLLHWQFFNKRDLMNISWNETGKMQPKNMEPYQRQFMDQTVTLVREKSKADSHKSALSDHRTC